MASTSPESGCYVYQPSNQNGTEAEITAPHTPMTKQRLEAFTKVWEPTSKTLDDVLALADSGSVEEICQWLSGLFPKTLERIPAGLITTSTASSLFSKVSAQADADILLISVPAPVCHNLKSALKCIVTAVSSRPDFASTINSVAMGDGRLLNYDLETVQHYCDSRSYEKVLLYFGAAEALHGGVLSDLVDVLDAWRDRIPFICIFETAVGVELFQEKLTRRALTCLRGESFETATASDAVEAVFRAAATGGTSQRLWIGANPASMLVDRQAEHLQSAQAFVMSVKYMHMVHFYRNPLSILLSPSNHDKDGSEVEWTDELTEAAVKTRSFQNYLAELKAKKNSKEATRLAKDAKSIKELALSSIEHGQKRLHGISAAVQVLHAIHSVSPSNKSTLSWSKLYVQAMAGSLLGSPMLRNILLSVRAMASDTMSQLLPLLDPFSIPELPALHSELTTLLETELANGSESAGNPLRSEHDASLETMRATVVAKKISLSKHRAALSKGDTAYSALVKRISAAVDAFLKHSLVAPRSLLFNEVFVFDLRVPLREAFAPRPRHALERALTVPGAYLACECCEPDQRSLNSSQPATAILYQLYLESGALVNIADLWAAFDAVIESPVPDDAGDEEMGNVEAADQKLALFYRSLAELSYLGMVKSSRKRADHLVKMRFLGL